MAGRRTNTRERIQQVALELFAERGYDKTTLQEVADRLEITRPALYYHFSTKEAILASVVDRLLSSIDELVRWAHEQPATTEARKEILRRIADLLEDQWGPLLRFAQLNQGAVQRLPAGGGLQAGVISMLSLLTVPGADADKQFEARLAVFAVILGSVPFLFDMELPDSERSAVALRVATKLISD
ncbi:TetR/AcrR family transcriptional regulator [Nonomuraea sp. NPDC002799]